MLPGPRGVGTADHHRLPGRPGTHRVRHDTRAGPIPAADHVSGTHRDHSDGRIGRGKIIMYPSAYGHFRARLRCAVGVLAAERICFAITEHPLDVLVALIAG